MKTLLIIYIVSWLILLIVYVSNNLLKKNKSGSEKKEPWYIYLLIILFSPICAVYVLYDFIAYSIKQNKEKRIAKIEKIIEDNHIKKLLNIEVQDEFWGIKFGDSLEYFKSKIDSTNINELDKIYLKSSPGFISYVVNDSHQLLFQDTKWDFVIFDFHDNKFCSIRFVNDKYYHLTENIPFDNNKSFNQIFNSFANKYDLINKKIYHGASACGIFKNFIKISIDLEDSSMCLPRGSALVNYDTSNICLRFMDLSICGEE